MYFKNLLAFNFLIKSFSKSLLLGKSLSLSLQGSNLSCLLFTQIEVAFVEGKIGLISAILNQTFPSFLRDNLNKRLGAYSDKYLKYSS